MIVKKLSQSVARDNSARVNALFRRNSVFRDLRLTLFDQGQQGLFFVPKPILESEQTLYQGSDGTTLTDANGDPVGLGLEWSRGLELGPELVTNGTFDTDLGGWSYSSSASAEHWQWESGRAYHPFTDIYSDIRQSVSGEGVYTEIRFDIEGVSGFPNFIVDQLDGTILQFAQPEVSGVVSQSYIIEDVVQIRFARRSTGAEFYIDNISVRELPGNHLPQSVSADRPTYNTDGSLHWLGFDGAGDNLQTTYASAVTQPCVLSIAMDRKDTSTSKIAVTGLDVSTRHQISFSSGGLLVAASGGSAITAGEGVSVGKHVVTAVFDGADSSIRLDGVVIATGSLDNVSSTGITLSSLWDGTSALQQDVYGLVHVEGVGDIDRIESYLNDLIGGNVL